MKLLTLKKPLRTAPRFTEMWMLIGLLLLLWLMGRKLIQINDPTAGMVEQDIWLYALQGLIVFLIMLVIVWWLLQYLWMVLDLPSLNSLIIHFKTLQLCQQLGFYFASFALLLLAATGCLIAVC